MTVQEPLALVWQRTGMPNTPQQAPAGPHQPGPLDRWVGQVCAAVAEVAAGDRSARQLFRIMTPTALERLQRRARMEPSRNAPVRKVLSVRLSRPAPTTVEAMAVVQGARRCQAVAIQLRRRGNGWIVTAAEIR